MQQKNSSFALALKILKTLIRWGVWTAIGLYLLIIILLHLPSVQRFVGAQVADALAKKLGTKVRIERVDLGFLNHFIVDGLVIDDQNGRQMAKASRVAAQVDLLSLVNGDKVRISSAQIFGLNAQLYRATPDAKANFQFVIDSLKSRDTTHQTPLDLRIQSLIIRHGNVRYDLLSAPATPNRLNFNHLNVSNISAHINLNTLTDNRTDINVRNLSFAEASGLDVRNLRLHLKANKQLAEISNLLVQLPQSKINVPAYKVRFNDKSKNFNFATAHHLLRIEKSYLTPSDIACLLPSLQTFNQKLYLNTNVSGTANQLKIKMLALRYGNNEAAMTCKGGLARLTTQPAWNFNAMSVLLKGKLLQHINNAFQLKLPAEISRLGDVRFRGKVRGARNYHHAKGTLMLAHGNADIDFLLRGKTINAELHTPHFTLGNILTSSQLGTIAADIKVEASSNLRHINAKGIVPRLDYNGYSYRNIAVNGNYTNDTFSGKASINDLNGKLAIDGTVGNIRHFIEKKGMLMVNARIDADRLNLHNMHITDALGDRTLSFQTTLAGSGASVNDLIGKLTLDNFVMQESNSHRFKLDHLELKAANRLMGRSVDLLSDFGTLSVSGRFNYTSMVQSVRNVVGIYLPALTGTPQQWGKTTGNNVFHIEADITNTQLLHELTGLQVGLSPSLRVFGDVNEAHKTVALNVSAPRADYSGYHFENLSLALSTHNNALNIGLKGEWIDGAGRRLALQTIATAKHNELNTLSSFNAFAQKTLRGQIDCSAQFERQNGKLATHLHFAPSKIRIDTIDLQVQPSELTYVQNNLNIKHFELSNKEQHIIINGLTSGNPADSLTVQLKDIDVPYILDIVNFHSVAFNGLASGRVVLKSVFNHPRASANLIVKQFQFERGDMGTLYAQADYSNTEGRININAEAIDEGASTNIEGYIDLRHGYINLPIYAHDTRLTFMKKFCGSFMDDIKLRGNGWVKVVGKLSDVNLEGDMLASGSVRIKPLGTTYTVQDGRVTLVPNEISLNHIAITDPEGHKGVITGGLHHRALRRLTFDIDVQTKNLLTYNFARRASSGTFWGRIYGTGKCEIIGRNNEITMNVDVTPNRNSFITYNAAKNAIDENSFIRWRDMTPDSLQPTLKQDTAWLKRPAKDEYNTNLASDLHINFHLNTTPDFTMKVLMDENTGDNITLNGSGVLRATYYNKGAFQLFGNYNVERGAYNLTIQNVIKRQFTFSEGSLIAFGGDPYAATLKLKGHYTLNSVPLSDLQMGSSFRTSNTKVDCLLDINGTPEAPSITFGLNLPELSSDARQMVLSVLNSEQDLNQQVLYLLAVGRFYPQTANNAGQRDPNQSGQASLVMQSILSGTLSQQINTVLSNVIKDNHWNFGANIATGNDGFSNAEYEGILSGSLLNNRLLINGEFGYRDNVATNTSAFIGDFDIKYLLLPNGNIALNFYNRANDRYFTRNSLNTQGIGVIMKKDFTNLRELFHWRKKKKK